MTDIIRFVCPVCGQKYRAPTRLAGRHRVCVKCATPYDIPSPEAAASQQPQQVAVGAASSSGAAEAPLRIPPAGPISQYAAALSESHADAAADSAASQLAAEPEPAAPQTHPCPVCNAQIPLDMAKCRRCTEIAEALAAQQHHEPPKPHQPDTASLADALAKAELSAADTKARAERAAADARAKADEVAAVARRNAERIAAINRQIEMQAESDYRQVLLRAADSLSAAEKSAISQCRFCSDVFHAVERMGIDPVAAMSSHKNSDRTNDTAAPKDTLTVMTHVIDLIGNPPARFKRAYEKIIEAFAAYARMEELAKTPPTDMPAREASLADLHNRFTAAMTEMRGLIRTSGS